MSRPDDNSVQSPGRDRVLRFGAVRIHNGHLQSGRQVTNGCPVCTEGLESALAAVAAPEREAEVDKGDGGDEEDDAALAHRGGPHYS